MISYFKTYSNSRRLTRQRRPSKMYTPLDMSRFSALPGPAKEGLALVIGGHWQILSRNSETDTGTAGQCMAGLFRFR